MGEETGGNRICLNMIVRDEARVIERCLGSVADVLAAYVICDTGSRDDTRERIRRFMRGRGIPGEIHEDPWVNFGENRNLALKRARDAALGDYILIIDADEQLVVERPSALTRLRSPCYSLEKRNAAMRWAVPALFRRDLDCNWRGVLHEYLQLPSGVVAERMEGAHILVTMDGTRSQRPDKYLRDAELLEEALRKDPADARSCFYLAQSYRDAGKLDRAAECYARRVEMGGWAEEAFIAQLERGKALMNAGHDYDEFLPVLLQAWEMRSTRAEPLYELTLNCRRNGRFRQGYLFGREGIRIPRPTDVLFVAEHVYAYAMLDEFSVCAYHSQRYRESEECCQTLLDSGRLPEHEVPRVRTNLRLSAERRDLGSVA